MFRAFVIISQIHDAKKHTIFQHLMGLVFPPLILMVPLFLGFFGIVGILQSRQQGYVCASAFFLFFLTRVNPAFKEGVLGGIDFGIFLPVIVVVNIGIGIYLLIVSKQFRP